MKPDNQGVAEAGLGQYAKSFAEEDISFSVLPDLTDQDLKDIGCRSVTDASCSASILFWSFRFLVRLSARGIRQLRKEQSGDQLRRRRANPPLFMPAISADDHHSAVNPHETMQRLFAFALEYHFPIVAFTSASHFCGSV